MSIVSDDVAPHLTCFTPGAMVQSDRGPISAERLRPGDRILTRDDGFQVLKWIGARQLPNPVLRANPDLHPILIRQDALGQGLPLYDMKVSPAQVFLIPREEAPEEGESAGDPLVAVPARDLVGRDGVQELCTLTVVYIHLMFEMDATILVNGIWTDCHQPSRVTRRKRSDDQHRELLRIFPTLHRRAGRAGFVALRSKEGQLRGA